MRARIGTAAALGSLLIVAATAGCEARNLGRDPPPERFFFPSGVLLDPVDRVGVYDADNPDPDRIVLPPRLPELPGPDFMYVANGNNDRTYNAGTLLAIDLREFWRAWYDPDVDPQAQANCEAALPAAETALAEARAAKAAHVASTEDLDENPYTMDPTRAAAIDAAFSACGERRLMAGGVDPYCRTITTTDGARYRRCVHAPGTTIADGAALDESQQALGTLLGAGDAEEPGPGPKEPCRRLPLAPRVVECDERPFVRSVVRVGDFATTLASSIEEDRVRLWLPVRGDPSVTYIDAIREASPSNGRYAGVSLDCDQNPPDSELDPNLCGDGHRLDRLRDDPSLQEDDPALTPLDREPFNVAIWESQVPAVDDEDRGRRLAFVAHSSGSQLSMIDLDGLRGASAPAIVDLSDLYITLAGTTGGFGLAIRPCFEATEGPLGAADPNPNVPSITQGCRRPLVYTSFRLAGQLASFTASGVDVGAGFAVAFPPAQRDSCVVQMPPSCTVTTDPGNESTPIGVDCGGRAAPACDDDSGCSEVYAGPYCATPEQLGAPCAVTCEPQVRSSRRILPSLLLDTSLASAPVLGDMAFADPRGDQLLILQTNPGALLALDTSLGEDGEPLDIPSSPPLEICAEPSRMKIYTERAPDGTPVQRYALIACFRAALVYVVDLEALRVVDAVVVGTGPHDLAIDPGREVAYVINNLESSLSVIDLSRQRSTRFQEIARLGLQDPFTQ